MARKKKEKEETLMGDHYKEVSRNQIYEKAVEDLEKMEETISAFPASLEGLGMEARDDIHNALVAIQKLKEKVVFRDSKLTMRGL